MRALRQDVVASTAAVTQLQSQQTGEHDVLRDQLKSLDTKIAALESTLRDTQTQLSQLQARVDETDRRTRDTAAALDTLNEKIAKLVASATPPPATAPTPAPQTAARNLPPVLTPEQTYAAAVAMFRSREHGQAVLDFIDFIAKYPRHQLAPYAQSWIGEAYYVQRDYRQAILEFQKVLEFGLSNPKVPDALFKVGLSYRALRDHGRAERVFTRVVNDYPKSSAAAKAREFLKIADAKSPDVKAPEVKAPERKASEPKSPQR